MKIQEIKDLLEENQMISKPQTNIEESLAKFTPELSDVIFYMDDNDLINGHHRLPSIKPS